MRYFVWFDGARYLLSTDTTCNWIAEFRVFDMAYEYVTLRNGMDATAYSRWTIKR